MIAIPRSHLIFALACGALALFAIDARADELVSPPAPVKIVKTLAPGVTLTQEIDTTIPLLIDIVTVDLGAPGVKAEVGLGQDHIGGSDPTAGREDVSRYARRHHALVVVNGDYFPYTGDPLGIGIHDGELFSEPWTGNGKGGPREVLGIETGDNRAIIDKLGFHGDLTVTGTPPSEGRAGADGGAHLVIRGVDRVVGKDEIVVITPLFRGAKVNRPGGVDAVVTGVNLPLRANKIMQGTVLAIRPTPDGVDDVPVDGVILAGGPGKGGAALMAAMHPGDRVDFVMCVGDVANPAAGLKVADLPREGDLPSRGGAGVDRTAWTWGRMSEALGGGPRLLVNGEVAIDAAEDGFDPGFVDYRNPRTAVGLSADGRRMFIVTVDGRQSISRGVSLEDLALILKRYGASDAMNLDGGGSTAMAVAGITVDSPGGAGSERPVADMLVISSDRPDLDIPDWDPAGRSPAPNTDSFGGVGVSPVSMRIPPGGGLTTGVRLVAARDRIEEGQTTQVGLRDGGVDIDPAQILWQGPVTRTPPPGDPGSVVDDSPIGYVDQRGIFTALRAGEGTVIGLYRGRLIAGTITVTPKPRLGGEMAAIQGILSKVAGGADNRCILAIHVVLPDGSPVTRTTLAVSVTGGMPDASTVTTDLDGAATVEITWSGASGGLVTVAPAASAAGPTLLSVTLGQ